ncbi:T9SS type A sorting domain-containing protein [Croceimicrobium hydrocarbonivorans]|uniref:T9SS type A sorting domain-containing protein n=1 Tax=Croceimicrobium hydrocarbonivorans TaxID=2761580 RepID=A0A7H0VD79_9FLAO|nr:T9SS type A sorting domain-containing protein [Croceimicrobium hydrocarbonivorans]QNR23677.1 T9SS type A sorting domain-containing protein [Croceimicrobium hydrocarbonivorans]
MRRLAFYIIFSIALGLQAQSPGPYAPAAGQPGSTAIHKDSSLIASWAQSVLIQRGYLDIANKSLGLVSHGDSADALGHANGQVISLGDSGMATYSISPAIVDGPGAEFAIFENSFSDVFLEFAFVEVSSDGQNFERFPAQSLLDTNLQTGAFGASDPTKVHNLAGKYRADFGLPFDLAEISLQDSIRYIRIVDVIGSIQGNWATRDAQGRIINDPYPTDFASGGFDLDALALLHPSSLALENQKLAQFVPYPNPAQDKIAVPSAISLKLYNLQGQFLKDANDEQIGLDEFPNGLYILEAQLGSHQAQSFHIQIQK